MKRYAMKNSSSRRKFARTSYVHSRNTGRSMYRGGIRL